MSPLREYLTMGAIAISPTFWSLPRMARLATLGVAALTGVLIAGCSSGSFGQAGLSLPTADGVQTVSDAADALDTHRSTASENAKSAIAVTDALGSFVRDISADQRALTEYRSGSPALHLGRHYVVERNDKQVFSGSELVLRQSIGLSDYCQNSAGYSINGIPSLDETFGWQSGALSGGTRTANEHGLAIWSARASGAVVQGAIGGLSLTRNETNATCPMNAPAFILRGGTSENAFEIPIAMAFRGGSLFNLNVANGKFASGDTLDVTTSGRQRIEVDGIISNGRRQLATFRTDATGRGTLTITSTGAQYSIAEWIVVGI
jgi:hypothetical protein